MLLVTSSFWAQSVPDCQNIESINTSTQKHPLVMEEGILYSLNGITYNLISSNKAKVLECDNTIPSIIKLPNKIEYQGKIYPLTNIHYDAFANCQKLTSITIPSSVISIGANAFKDCKSLEMMIIQSSTPPELSSDICDNYDIKIYVPEGSVYRYKSHQYWGRFTNILEVETEEDDDNIQKGIIYEIIGGNAKVISCNTDVEGAIEVPSIVSINDVDYNVVEIGDLAFADCQSITKLIIGENIEKIGNSVFAGCSSLTEIEWNAINCSKIDDNDIYDCNLFYGNGMMLRFFNLRDQITSFKFGDNVEYIPPFLCGGLSKITSIKIPASVKNIGKLAFHKMDALSELILSKDNNWLCIENGVLYDKEKRIVFRAFPHMIVSTIELPKSVQTIQDAAFYDCTKLETITFSENITNIGCWVLGHSGIKEIIWNIPKFTSRLGNEGVALTCFDGMGVYPIVKNYDIRDQITSIKFGDSVEMIPRELCPQDLGGNYGFRIESIIIPQSVTEICDYAFAGCGELSSIISEAQIPPILGNSVFGNYSATVTVPISSLDSYKSDTNWSKFKNIRSYQHVINGITYEEISETEVKVVLLDSVNESDIILPSIINVGEKEFQVVEIEAKSFKDNDILKSITIPNTIRTIGAEAFMNCVNLEHVELPDSLTSIESHTFTNTALKNIVLPECLTEINTNAFSYTKLGSIVIPENVSLIVDAFTECSELKDVVWNAKHPYVIGSLPSAVSKIKFGESVELIPSKLCLGLTELTEITLPNSVNKIEANAFDGCKYLNKVIIGSGVTTIESEAFANCDRISQIIARPTKAPEIIKSNAFTSDSYNFTELLVNYGYKNHYSKELYWRNFKNIVEESSPNHFEIQTSGINASRGGRFSIPLNLINEDEIAGFQADIYMPSGFSISTIDGEYDIELSGRATTSHRLSYNVMSDGALRIIAYSPITKTFEGKEGVVINIKVKVAENFNGLSNIEVKNVVMTSPQNNEYRCSDLSFTINVKDSHLGNANGEGEVNISDVISTANYIVGGSTIPIDLTNADVNCDYVITVADVVGISNIILGKKNSIMSSNQRPSTLYSTESTSLKNSLFIEDFAINKGEEKELCLKLTNNVSFSAFQADLYLPTGLNIINDFELTDRKDNHSLLYSKRPDGSIRILSYSETSRDFKNNEDAIVKFTIIADSTFNNDILKIKNIIFTQQDITSYNLNDSETSISFSGVENIINNDSITVFVSNGEIVINGAYDAQIAVYNLNGSLIYRGKNQSIPVVNRGVYIVKINDKVVKLMI